MAHAIRNGHYCDQQRKQLAELRLTPNGRKAESVSMVKDVHGLENLYVGYWDSTNAPNLQAVRLGSGAAGYVNEATEEVSVGANTKLREVDLRGCVNFGKKTQKILDLAHCPNIAKVYLDGTNAKGVDLPNGGVLEELRLPESVAYKGDVLPYGGETSPEGWLLVQYQAKGAATPVNAWVSGMYGRLVA